uniref:Uncharacterized protein n=1 Tax=Phaeomonas parva TaxID=124430 RepID=A0A7S1U0Q9_9STRA|mmetsp:Transcript_23653/g.74408  ORF Transcript_23653/g.74408 Transcript_23653/m.74408 type:complete len:305 (+) Transcript_23653:305-1219(+)
MSRVDHTTTRRGMDQKMLRHAGLASQPAAAEEASNAGWSEFDRGSAAGKMMANLYGRRYQPKISYPTNLGRSRRASAEKRPEFIPGGAKLTQNDPRSRNIARNKARKVRAPKVGRRGPTYQFHEIDFIDRRRPAHVIQDELDDLTMRVEAYRPPNIMPVSTDAQKNRLQEINTFKGGNVLPNELTMEAKKGPLPSEAARLRQEADRVENLRRRDRGMMTIEDERREAAKARQNEMLARNPGDMMREQLRGEIQERQEHYEELVRLETDPQTLNRVKGEVMERLGELSRLERKLAAKRSGCAASR